MPAFILFMFLQNDFWGHFCGLAGGAVPGLVVNGRGWARLTPPARSFVCVSHTGAGTWALGHPLQLFHACQEGASSEVDCPQVMLLLPCHTMLVWSYVSFCTVTAQQFHFFFKGNSMSAINVPLIENPLRHSSKVNDSMFSVYSIVPISKVKCYVQCRKHENLQESLAVHLMTTLNCWSVFHN